MDWRIREEERSEWQKRAERLVQGLALFAALGAFAAVVALTSGCYSTDCGSKTIVGNHYSLPKLSSDATDFDFEIYQSTEGAVVYTRKDSLVKIDFFNAYTNHIFGVWDKVGEMKLAVEIEPLEVGATETAAPTNTVEEAAQ
jgi:hypothetical protein